MVGRAFRSRLVASAYPDLGSEGSVHDDLLSVARTRLIDLEDPQEQTFAFGHAVTRDVAYDSLPFSLRATLHGRVGDALESEPDGPRRHLDLLAYHYAQSDDLPKKRHYLSAAAAAARARVRQRGRHLPPVAAAPAGGGRASATESSSQLAESLEVGGDWGAAEDAVADAREAAEALGDVAGVARARTCARGARPQAGAVRRGRGRARGGRGRVQPGRRRPRPGPGDAPARHAWPPSRAHPDQARAAYEASLALRQRLGDEAGTAALLTNLALVAEDEGDLDAAERLGEEGLSRRRRLADRRAVSVSLTNMGMLATARGDLRAGPRRASPRPRSWQRRSATPGWWASATTTSATPTRDLGDLEAARGHFGPALATYVEHDDLWSLAHLFEDVAVWLLARGRGRRRRRGLVARGGGVAAGGDRRAAGSPRPQEALDEALRPALRAHAAAEVLDAARRLGGAADLGDVVARAVAFLSSDWVTLRKSRDPTPTASGGVAPACDDGYSVGVTRGT